MADIKEEKGGGKKQRPKIVFVKCYRCGRRIRQDNLWLCKGGNPHGLALCEDCMNKLGTIDAWQAHHEKYGSDSAKAGK